MLFLNYFSWLRNKSDIKKKRNLMLYFDWDQRLKWKFGKSMLELMS